MDTICDKCTSMWGIKKFLLKEGKIEETIFRYHELEPYEQAEMRNKKKDDLFYKCQDCRKKSKFLNSKRR